MLNGTILCIDDDETNLLVRKALLQSVGYSVLTASSALEGLSLFLHVRLNAVVLDFQMPEMNGAQVAAEMKRIRPNAPIIMLSAHPDLTNEDLRNTDAYLVKAENPTVLLETLARLIQSMGRAPRTARLA
jgi:CheY-like chemotaxis protein